MHVAVLIIVFLFALILSNLINRLFPRVPLPLIQIVFGGLLCLIFGERFIALDSELFLAFVISPLLFREGEESDITNVLRHWKIILYLIFPVVFISTLALGLATYKLLPAEVSLAACLAVGAALGPTDLVAFHSLSKRFQFPKHVQNILKGEGLLNDASGLVSFQVAITALVTGVFSLQNASFKLVLSVSGGVLIGLIVAFVNRLFLAILDSMDAADVSGVMLLEMTLPFIAYFLAEEIHGSGIIAVVIAGISQASRFKKITLLDAQIDNVGSVIWSMLSFLLNGVVFLMLGAELTKFARPVLLSQEINTFLILGVIVLVTLLLFGIRFVMIWLFYAYRSHQLKKELKRYLKDILVLTFSGVKGTVSVATILLLPSLSTVEYSMLLFVVAGVTLLSFLIGIVVLPKLASETSSDMDHYMQIAILNDVIWQLQQDIREDKSKTALYAVIDNYNKRLETLILDQESNEVKSDLALINIMILGIESDGLENAFLNGEIDMKEYRIYQGYLKFLERRINRGFISNLTYVLTILLRSLPKVLHEVFTFGSTIRQFLRTQSNRQALTKENRRHLIALYQANTNLVLEALQNLDDIYSADLVGYLIHSRKQEAQIIQSGAFVERVITRNVPDNVDEMLRGYYLERKVIAEYESDNLISHRYAKALRKEVNALENYSLKETVNTLSYDLFNYTRNRLNN
ncbi:cation:proton antiporter [Streptococcus sciuri]|uniref:Sodium:proton antiporter n=1 Tax=Streptococcus sciuri TaxID=2973939 RepID=A0ABT2F8L9_9STRE|nr:sodium:proton antiporter [Streptococcus sciuri]MCS4488764.1 sodium:proton antiporter [Streptococcus sciuri]